MDVSKLADSPGGISMGGQKMDGYIYWCQKAEHAASIVEKLDNLGASKRIYVAFTDEAGVVQWAQRQ